MIRLWSREIAGWLLLLLGLAIFYLCFVFLAQQLVVQAIPLTVIGIFVFRGGLHLLKVAVAAQICLEAKGRLYESPAATARLPRVTRPVSRLLPDRPHQDKVPTPARP
jgi:hypothetical protein